MEGRNLIYQTYIQKKRRLSPFLIIDHLIDFPSDLAFNIVYKWKGP
jgi:hypothetical protein